MIGCVDRRLVQSASGEQIAIAALGIQQAENLIELALGRFLRRGLARAIDGKAGLRRGRLNRVADFGDLLKHRLLDADARSGIRHRVIKAFDCRQLRVQCDGNSALRPEAGISIRLLSRPELPLQIGELFVDVQRRLNERGNI
ncbi:MAG TPA: hypothetical protein VF396_19265 [Bradyrhizobium sp.]